MFSEELPVIIKDAAAAVKQKSDDGHSKEVSFQASGPWFIKA
jgi:hypothetical protein